MIFDSKPKTPAKPTNKKQTEEVSGDSSKRKSSLYIKLVLAIMLLWGTQAFYMHMGQRGSHDRLPESKAPYTLRPYNQGKVLSDNGILRFNLYNACSPFPLFAEVTSDRRAEVYMEGNPETLALRIETFMTDILRPAGIEPYEKNNLLTDENPDSYLYINANFIGNENDPSWKNVWGMFGNHKSFNIHMAFMKIVDDPVSEQSTYAKTWDINMLGSSNMVPEDETLFLWEGIRSMTENFVNKYLSANQKECSGEEDYPKQVLLEQVYLQHAHLRPTHYRSHTLS